MYDSPKAAHFIGIDGTKPELSVRWKAAGIACGIVASLIGLSDKNRKKINEAVKSLGVKLAD